MAKGARGRPGGQGPGLAADHRTPLPKQKASQPTAVKQKSSPGSRCGHGQVTCQARPGTATQDWFSRQGILPTAKAHCRGHIGTSVCRGHLALGASWPLTFVSTSRTTTTDLTTRNGSGMTQADCLFLQPSKAGVSEEWACCPQQFRHSCLHPP